MLRHGPRHAATLLDGLIDWIGRKGFGSIAKVRGLRAVPASIEAADYERTGYVNVLQTAQRTYIPW